MRGIIQPIEQKQRPTLSGLPKNQKHRRTKIPLSITTRWVMSLYRPPNAADMMSLGKLFT